MTRPSGRRKSLLIAASVLLVAAACSRGNGSEASGSTEGNHGIEGVLPDGTRYVLFAPGFEATEPTVDALIVIDAPGVVTQGVQAQVIGEHRWGRVRPNAPAPQGALLTGGSWRLEIRLYPEVEQAMERNGWALDALAAMREERGLPVLALQAPLRLAGVGEGLGQLEVAYGPLAVRKGCDRDQAVACSEDGQLQVVAIEPTDRQLTGVSIETR